MKTRFLIAAAALAISAAPVLANTPTADPFGTLSKDQPAQSAPDQNAGDNAYVAPFGDHLQQRGADDLHPMNDEGADDR